ncbi:MAG: hypothetical protein V3U87_07685 [Methylococcaceae bacterium]
MAKTLDEIFTFFGFIALCFFAYKYYSYSQIDTQIEEMCLYGSLAPVRPVIKIENQNTSKFCTCWGQRAKSKISTVGIFITDQKEIENAIDYSSFDCRRAIQGR